MEEIKIGFVTEGHTDYWVLKHIVANFLKSKNLELEPVQLQPKTAGEGILKYGTWHNVFEYISKEEYIIDLAQKEECQYIIVQLDTDVAGNPDGYLITKPKESGDLYDAVVAAIMNKTHQNFDKAQIIPAVCIESLECWLIPFVTNTSKKCQKTANCCNAINQELRGLNLFIDCQKKGDASAAYDHILKQKKKAKDIKDCSIHNLGFSKFIEKLESI